MAEQNTGRTEEPSNNNNSNDNGNTNLTRILEKAQEKQHDNLTTKLTETLSSSLKKLVTSLFKITKGSGKRMQEDHVGQVLSKRPELMLSARKRKNQLVQNM